MMEVGATVTLAGVIAAWLGFIEHRLHGLSGVLEQRIEDKNAINQVIQRELKEDLVRIEGKLDTMITIQLTAMRKE